MVPELGATPERPPRGGRCCAGDVQSRRNGRVRRLTSEGNVCQTSTPMTRHMAEDLTKVAQMSEAVGTWYSQRRNDVAIFRGDQERGRGRNARRRTCDEPSPKRRNRKEPRREWAQDRRQGWRERGRSSCQEHFRTPYTKTRHTRKVGKSVAVFDRPTNPITPTVGARSYKLFMCLSRLNVCTTGFPQSSLRQPLKSEHVKRTRYLRTRTRERGKHRGGHDAFC